MLRRDKNATGAAGASGGDRSLPRVIGLDGWPVGGPSDAEIAQAAEAQYRQEMQAVLERLRRDDLPAFAEAIRLYWKQHPDFPYELVEASGAVVEAARAEKEKHARLEWRIARTRWETMTDLLERWPELNRTAQANLKRAKELIASNATTAQERTRLQEILPELMEAANDDRGRTVESARDAVSEALKNDEAAGAPGAIKYSYDLVEAAGGEHATFESYLIVRRKAAPG